MPEEGQSFKRGLLTQATVWNELLRSRTCLTFGMPLMGPYV
jgi:hypothetical protein